MSQTETLERCTPGVGTGRAAARVVELLLVAVVAWGVLAFGAVYPWAYWPLLGGAVLVGVIAFGVAVPVDPMPRPILPILIALVFIAGVALVQTVPLPAAVRTALSPGTEPFLRSTDVQYTAAAALEEQGATSASAPRRPLSLNAAATNRAVALLAGFTVLLAGLNRYFGRHGVRGIVPALVGLGVLVAIIGIVQKAVFGDHAWGGMKIYGFWAPQYKLTTPFGPFVNKNHYAGWMLMTLPLAVG
jgi:fatty acid desaturase